MKMTVNNRALKSYLWSILIGVILNSFMFATTTYAMPKVTINIDNKEDNIEISIQPLPAQLTYEYKILSDYLIINFNKPIAYNIRDLSRNKIYKYHNYNSKDQKTIFIKLGFKPEKILKTHNKSLSVLNIRKNIVASKKVLTPNIGNEKVRLEKLDAKLDNTKLTLSQVAITKSDANYIILSFDWDKQTSCAAFSQGQYSWIIFDQNKVFDISLLQALGLFEDIKVLYQDNYTIFRFKHSLSGELKAQRDELRWDITFMRDNKIQVFPGSLINETNSLKSIGRMFDAREATSFIKLFEEVTGETLLIVPLNQSDIGVAIPRNFIDYYLMRSAQGMVIRQVNEDIKITLSKVGVEISSPNYVSNITLHDKVNEKTREILKQQAQSANIEGIPNYTMLPFLDKDINNQNSEYLKNYYKNLSEISRSSADNINDKRYDLAKYFFLNHMYPEAIAVLNYIANSSPKYMLQRPEVKFLQAVSLTLASHYDEAEKIYRTMSEQLQGSKNIQEIKLWLSLNNFYQYNTNNYIGFLDNDDNLIFTYPAEIYWKIALAELEIAIKNDNIDLADKIFSSLREFKGNNDRLVNDIKYLRARYYILKGETEKAKQYLKLLQQDTKDPYNQIRAQIEDIKLQLSQKELGLEQAIAQLNSIKQNWRGDFVEYDLLMLLAKLYRENSQSIQALRTYKYIIGSSPLKTDQLFITAEMIALFDKIFSPAGEAETMSDFNTVSLFYEFKELTPIGAAGDRIVLSIANRLVSLDLLETAEALLNHQIKYRLIGERRVNVGDQLAYVYLINKKPELAINTLDDTDKDNYSYIEHLKRIRLKAKAYSDMMQYEVALNLLREDTSIPANFIREEIYFKNQNWDKLIKLLEPELLNRVNKGEEFYDTDRQELLRLLIPYLMVNNKEKLKFLKDNLKTSNIEIKNLLEFFVTQNKILDYKDLENTLNIKNIEKFLNSIKGDLFKS